MTNEEATNVLGDVRAYLSSRASLENEILAGHTFIDICNAIKSLEQETSWIPCSEELPRIKNQTEKYLVTLKNGTVCDAMFTECDGEHWWNYNYDDVIAWQELPKPYKAETKE